MNERKLEINGVTYLRADLFQVAEALGSKIREYTVIGIGQDKAGETIFLRLKGIKSVVFKTGDRIAIVKVLQPTNQQLTIQNGEENEKS